MDKKKQKIRETIDTYGANTKLWPEDVASYAEALLESDAELKQYLDDAAATDALLQNYHIEEPDLQGLEARILCGAFVEPVIVPVGKETSKKPSALKQFWTSLFGDMAPSYVFAPGGGMMAAAVLGFWLSFSGVVKTPHANQDGQLLLDPVFYSEMAMEDIETDLILYTTEGAVE